jgi:ribose transport system substrate-binding protein
MRSVRRVCAGIVAVLIMAGTMNAVAGTPKKDIKLGLIYSIAIPFFNPSDVAARDQEKALGIKILVEKPAKADVAHQMAIIENFLAQKVDGLIICSVGEGITPVINRAVDSGVPVFMFAVDNVSSKRLAYFGTDNATQYAVDAAEYLAKMLGGKGNVAASGGVATAPDQIARAQGFKKHLAERYPQIKVLDLQYGNADTARTLGNIEGMFQAHKLDGFWAFNSMSGGAIATVMKDIGKAHRKVLADHDYPDIIKAVRDGYIDATQVQKPYKMTFDAIQVMYEYLNGKKPEKTLYYTGTIFITKDNVDQYYDEKNNLKAMLK